MEYRRPPVRPSKFVVSIRNTREIHNLSQLLAPLGVEIANHIKVQLKMSMVELGGGLMSALT